MKVSLLLVGVLLVMVGIGIAASGQNIQTSFQSEDANGGDAGNSVDEAMLLAPGSYVGELSSYDPKDFYKFHCEINAQIEISMQPPSSGDFDLYVYDSHGNRVAYSDNYGNQEDSVSFVAEDTLYYILVYRYTGSGEYSLVLEVSNPQENSQNDAGSGGDAGNSMDEALTIQPGNYIGHLDSGDQEDYYRFSVEAGSRVTINMLPPEGADFDIALYSSGGEKLGSSTAGGSDPEEIIHDAAYSGSYYLRVYIYRGEGDYHFAISVQSAPEQNDANSGHDAGNTISTALEISPGTYSGHLDPNDQQDFYKVHVDGGEELSATMSPPTSADFDLAVYDASGNKLASSTRGTGYTDSVTVDISATGDYFIRVYVYSGAGDYSLTVSISGSGQNDAGSGGDAGDSISDALSISPGTYTGALDSNDINDYYGISISAGDTLEVSVTPPSSADFDLYLYDQNGESIASSTKGTGYTDSASYTSSSGGTYYIRVYLYSGSGEYSLQITITTSGSGDDYGDVRKFALIVGISDFKAINDLSYCDEDANSWYDYLASKGFIVYVLGDTHQNNYEHYDGLAREANVKAYLQQIISTADGNDIIAFVTSGHGSGDGHGNSYLCMWDCAAGENGEDGNLYDYEIASIFSNANASKIFMFFDNCYSGGILDDLASMPNSNKVWASSTCTENGYGYDDPDHQHGAWTYWFLIEAIQHRGYSTMESAYNWAKSNYPHSGGDTPQMFDGNPSVDFVL